MEAEITLASKLKGAIYGLLIGDALGVPYEFSDAASLPSALEIEYEPPAWFRRAHAGVPPGTWSDDGAQALVLLHSLLERGGFDIDHFAKGLVAWHDEGFFAIDGLVFDVGIQTRRSIAELKVGISPIYAGGIEERSNGNGSLMRCLPLALWHRGPDDELIRLAFEQSAPTHGHLRSKLCCALHCLWARGIIRFIPDAWGWAVETLKRNLTDEQNGELDHYIEPTNRGGEVKGSGYVVDCLHAARWASERGGFEEAVRAAILLGDDTDTTACVTGGIVGLSIGVEKIPQRWINELRGKEIVEPLVAGLIDRYSVSI